jgi:hypothetical protein
MLSRGHGVDQVEAHCGAWAGASIRRRRSAAISTTILRSRARGISGAGRDWRALLGPRAAPPFRRLPVPPPMIDTPELDRGDIMLEERLNEFATLLIIIDLWASRCRCFWR